jgi:cytochrome d ubiquinol oxidase subunit II
MTTVWFVLIAVLWTGYFVLEGFDFGVGVLLPFLARDDADRRMIINSIGPVWDGNEVWLLVAGGATFAAFPQWYATLFSGFYLPLLLILVSLIVRGVAFEYRGKIDSQTWRTRWDRAIFVSSLVPAILWGVAFGNIVRGVPIDSKLEYTGGFFNLLNVYSLLGGLATLSLFALHGGIFLSLKTSGEMRHRAQQLVNKLAPVTIAVAALFLLWTQIEHGKVGTAVTSLVAAVALIGGCYANYRAREGWAFLGTAITLALTVVTLFWGLWPNVMPSSTDAAFNLTVYNASSTAYTLGVMTWVAAIFTPVVLCYQAWTYWVFRKRLRKDDYDVTSGVPARHPVLDGSPTG